jgi:hypothetical protein
MTRCIVNNKSEVGSCDGLYRANDMERTIEMVNSTMAMEDMPLTDEDKDRLRSVLRGETSTDEMVQQLVEKHRRNTDCEHFKG